jgi:hypothetical protein
MAYHQAGRRPQIAAFLVAFPWDGTFTMLYAANVIPAREEIVNFREEATSFIWYTLKRLPGTPLTRLPGTRFLEKEDNSNK